jgi:acyl transferase domain-containing protein/enoyl-CoA hydratase/carnithine racemase/acyl carrier protein/SAM-dependent methyltransferase
MTQALAQIYRELSAGTLTQEQALVQIKAAMNAPRSPAADARAETLYAAPVWEAATGGDAVAWTQRRVLVCGLPHVDAGEHIAVPADASVEAMYTSAALACFDALQTILRGKPDGRCLVQLVAADNANGQVLAGLAALFETAALENPLVAGQVILVPANIATTDLAQRLRAEDGADRVVRYAAQRQVRRWRLLDAMPAGRIAFKEHGVYLVTGGLGGLGRLVARDILERASQARVVLVGRTPLDAAAPSLAAFASYGMRVDYRQADIADRAQVEALVADIVARHGGLHGVVHGAGVLHDEFLIKQSAASFRGVLAPKVDGTTHLDAATRSLDLDCFVLFSSIAAWAGNVGQAGYAAANGFLDAWAVHRNVQVTAGERRGRTLSIAWPHWIDGGMQIDAASLVALERRTGLRSMPTDAGLAAFERALASTHDHVMVMHGVPAEMSRALDTRRSAPAPVAPRAAAPAGDLREPTRRFLRDVFATVLKIPAERIETQAPLEQYGIDSIRAMDLTAQLEATFGTLAKTLFFEYQTIDELADHFVRTQAAALQALFGTNTVTATPVAVATPTPVAANRRRGRYLPAVATATPAPRANDEVIAIVGLSGRYPQSRDIEAFWRNLRDGRDCIEEIPASRWNWREWYSEDRTREGAHYSRWGGFIDGVDEFDPRFFNIAPREARTIDPQERLFLQHAWSALEDAGITRAMLDAPDAHGEAGQVGVYAGVMYGEYNLSGTLASIANRVSYFLNLHGPSLTLDTMCSSSLTAMHLACQDLKLGRTALALAGGVNVSVHPNKYTLLSGGQFISGDGHCQSFGEGGDGYIPGEGVGVVVLKRLSDALRDGNVIHGLVRGTALNHGGKTNGYTVPNPRAQADVIRRALADARVDARHVSYVEAHGTGTKLGDPIEIAALTRAYDNGTPAAGWCLIGSAKSNIGHCESAAGVAGVTKVLLQMRHGAIVPSLHSQRLNPHIDFAATPFVVNQTLRPWTRPIVDGHERPRIAGISSFGAGGSNAHVIIEEYRAPMAATTAGLPTIVPLSARTAEQLVQRARDLAAWLDGENAPADLAPVAWTLQAGREAMEERAAFVVRDTDELVAALDLFVRGESSDNAYRAQVKTQREALAGIVGAADFADTLERWMAQRDLAPLARLWCRGHDVDWRRLAGGESPRRVSLPTYPFATERYWVEPAAVAASAQSAVLHPLVHENRSTLRTIAFASTFTGHEAFLDDDGGTKSLPPAVLDEMMRAAAQLAEPASAGRVWALADAAWGDAAVVVAGRAVGIALIARDDDEVDVEIHGIGGDEPVYAQGRVVQRAPDALPVPVAIPVVVAAPVVAPVIAPVEAAPTPRRAAVPREIPFMPRGEHIADTAPVAAKPADVRLPAAADVSATPVAAKPTVTLAPLTMAADAAATVRLFDAGDDTFVIELHDTLAATLAPLSLALQRVRAEPAAKAVRLVGRHDHAWRGGRDVADSAIALGVFDAIATLPAPVVAVVGGDASGAGLLLAAVCDFAVCADEAQYGFGGDAFALRAMEAAFLAERLGDDVAASLRRTTAPLRAHGWTCRSAPLEQLDAAAQELAAALADKPVHALQLLKAHLNRDLAARVAAFRNDELAAPPVATSRLALLPSVSDEAAITALDDDLQRALADVDAITTLAPVATFGDVVSLRATADGVAVIEMHDRNAKNLFSPALVAGLKQAFAQVEEVSLYKSIVIVGFDSYFSSGGTRDTLLAIQSGEARFTDETVFEIALACPLPVVAAVQGHAIGGGWSLGLFADVVLLAEESRYLSPYMGYGFTPGAGATLVQPLRLGHDLARETLMTARETSGRALRERGVRVPVLPRRDVLPAALRIATAFARRPREVLVALKQRWTQSLRTARADVYRREVEMHAQTFVDNAQTLATIAATFTAPVAAAAPARRAAHVAATGIVDTIRTMLAQELIVDVADIDEDTPFVDLGLDSVTGVTWIRRINAHYGIELEATKVYSHPSLRALAGQIADVANNVDVAPVDAPPARPRPAGVTERLKTMLAEELHLAANEIDEHTPFIDLGLDSITGVTWVRRINAHYGIAIEATTVYRHPTLAELAGLVEHEATDVAAPVVHEPQPQPAAPVAPRIERRRLTSWRRQPRPAPAATATTTARAPIAVIGMAGQFPQARDLDAYWANLAAGRDCVDDVADTRWRVADWYRPGAPTPGKTYGRWLGALAEHDRFDPLFFNISPTEAEGMEPQQRVFLEACWHAIENAGHDPHALSGSDCGVFVGCGASDYHEASREARLSAQGFTGGATSILAARIAYFLNLRGPCVSIDTACSSSLVAIANACDGLNAGNCDIALAGGVYVMAGPAMHVMTAQAGMLSPDGRCRTFDQRANGFVPGEGVGVVMLKRLADAERDGDRIDAVIEGWGVNQDGKTNGITAPNQDAQTRLLQSVYRRFGIDPGGIGLVEAHGTGTKLGDPIEVAGLKAAFAPFTDRTGYCALGSVKSNIGHCLTAAGAAGFIKLALALRHRALPPTIHYDTCNEHIRFDASPFFVNTALTPWRVADGERRRAAISSFGFSGTNAHLVVAEPAARNATASVAVVTEHGRQIVPLSARTEAQLKQQAQNLLALLRRDGTTDLTALAYTLQTGRAALDERVAFLADSADALAVQLDAWLAGRDTQALRGSLRRHRDEVRLLSQDADMRATVIGRWLADRKLGKLAELWAKGLEIDWLALYGATRPARLVLPEYPFARERYWLATSDVAPVEIAAIEAPRIAPAPVVITDVAANDAARVTLTTPVWDAIAVRREPARDDDRRVLVVGADDVQRAVFECRYGDAATFVSLDADATVADVATLLGGVAFERIVLVATAAPVATLTEESLVDDQRHGILAVLRIARALTELGFEKRAIEWDIVTLVSIAIADGEATNPAHAGLQGFSGSLADAYPFWKIRQLDLTVLDDDAAARLHEPPQAAKGACYALRGGEWFAQKLVPVTQAATGAAPYRRGGVYVVIGGAGGIGEIYTRHLIERYDAHVIWIGRRPLDATIRAKLDAFAPLGRVPDYVQADASRPGELAAAVATIRQRHAAIHGVVHSAVGAFDQNVKTVSEDDFRTILAVKIDLSVRIAQAFAGEPLDFVLFFSSNAAFVRGAGMAGYSAGCTFKDAYARELGKRRPYTVKTVNWGYWPVGAGEALTDAMKTYFHETGYRPLEAAEGMAALDAFLAGGLAQLSITKLAASPVASEAEAIVDVGTNGMTVDVPALLAAFDARALPARFDTVDGKAGAEMETRLPALLAGILRATPAVAPAYARWLDESRRIAAPHADDARSLDALWADWDAALVEWQRDDGKRALCGLVDRCLRALPDILGGRRKATDVLFPRSSLELVEDVYKSDRLSLAFNDGLCDALLAAVQARLAALPDARLRVLEIGAGTGATTVGILDRLAPLAGRIAEYCYTDLSKAFLAHAQEHYAPRAPYLSTRIFNVEKPVAEQGVDVGGYDFVVAANVIHATRNIRNAVRNAKALLRPGGVLLLNEISDKSICGHLTFGLLDGWWLNEDDDLRIPGSPGLYPDGWQRLLALEGFRDVRFPCESVHRYGQQIVAAVSDGIARQRANAAVAPVRVAPPPRAAEPQRRDPAALDALLRSKTVGFCKRLVGKALKLDANEIDAHEPLEHYGIDSIIIGLVNQELSKHFDDVGATLLYEFQTVDALAAHLVETRRDTLLRMFDAELAPAAAAQPAAVVAPVPRVEPAVTPIRIAAPQADTRSPLAVIGISGRYPGAGDVDAYWENLKAGVDGIGEIPPERWSLDGFYEPDERTAVERGKSYCKSGGFLDGFAQFDPLFFGIPPREALNMDPQERLFMQSAWSAMENAGYSRAALKHRCGGRVGVFAGITRAGYNLYRGTPGEDEKFWPRTSFASVANRLSYFLDIHGPSLPVDTMCSSSLTAIHEACEHIRNGDCDLAFAGGVNLYLHPTSYVDMSSQHMLSKTGACRSFGAGGDGFVPGEGVGVVLLKSLDRAIADGDPIHGVILATHVNHGGKTNGFTVPNPVAQAELVRRALDKAGISARDVSYIEAHGTGTELGDPIEIAGLQQAFGKDTRDTGYCRVGSAKSNIGHLEAAAGIAGLTKVLLQLKHRQIAPSLHAQSLNPQIAFERTAFVVNRDLAAWDAPVVDGRARPRIAGISSFGAGGANAHVIVQEYVAAPRASTADGPVIVPLSAKSQEQLRQVAANLRDFVRDSDAALADIAYTQATGREPMEWRACIVAASRGELADRLDACARGDGADDLWLGQVQRNQESLGLFAHDDDLAEAVERWIARRKFGRIAELWVKGFEFDWQRLYGDAPPLRIALPTYPFARETYWPDSVAANRAAPRAHDAPTPGDLRDVEEILRRIDEASLDAAAGVDLLKSLV